jgi:hypothetical protein
MGMVNKPSNKPLFSFDAVLDLLIAPNSSVEDIQARQNARLAAIISLSLIIVFTGFMARTTLSGEPSTPTDLFSYFMLLGIYIFSRTRLHQGAIWLLMLLAPGNTFINVWLGTTYDVQQTLYFLAIGYGMAAIFLKRRWTIIFTAANVISLLLTPQIAPEGLISLDQLDVHITINIILGTIAIIATTHKANIEREREDENRRNNAAALSSLMRALEFRHNETAVHTNQAVDLSIKLAQRCGIRSPKHLRQIREGAMLHDIGKIAVPDGILLKEEQLTDSEWEIIKMHPRISFELLEDFDFLQDSLAIPHYHHERFDGSGYPYGLAGEEIPIEARIFAVVDVYDALLEDRPYRDAWPADKVIEYIQENRGSLFDPHIVDIFIELVNADPNNLTNPTTSSKQNIHLE